MLKISNLVIYQSVGWLMDQNICQSISGLDSTGIILFYCLKTIENNRKTMKTVEIIKNYLVDVILLWKLWSTFYSSFKYLPLIQCFDRKIVILWNCTPKNVHNFKSWNDTTRKFSQNASDMWIWKVIKMCHQKLF